MHHDCIAWFLAKIDSVTPWGKRDPEVHQSKKGNDWHLGMRVHVGVVAASGLAHISGGLR